MKYLKNLKEPLPIILESHTKLPEIISQITPAFDFLEIESTEITDIIKTFKLISTHFFNNLENVKQEPIVSEKIPNLDNNIQDTYNSNKLSIQFSVILFENSQPAVFNYYYNVFKQNVVTEYNFRRGVATLVFAILILIIKLKNVENMENVIPQLETLGIFITKKINPIKTDPTKTPEFKIALDITYWEMFKKYFKINFKRPEMFLPL